MLVSLCELHPQFQLTGMVFCCCCSSASRLKMFLQRCSSAHLHPGYLSYWSQNPRLNLQLSSQVLLYTLGLWKNPVWSQMSEITIFLQFVKHIYPLTKYTVLILGVGPKTEREVDCPCCTCDVLCSWFCAVWFYLPFTDLWLLQL